MGKNRTFGIRAKIGLGYIALLLCLAITAFLLINRMYALQQELRHIVDHDLEVHNLSNRLEKHMLDMETGQRGFVITGKSSYLEPYNNGKNTWQKDYNDLRARMGDTPSQLQKLEDIRDLIQTWIRTAGDATINLKESNDAAGLAKFYESDPGKRYMDKLRIQMEEFRSTEKLFTQNRVETLETLNRWIQTQIYLLITAAIILSCIVTLVVSGSIVGTINRVSATIRSLTLSEGQIGTRITVSTKDEVRELAESTNGLLERMERRNWIKTQSAEFAGSYQGQANIRSLAEAFIQRLAHTLNLPYGIVYIRQPGRVSPTYAPAAAYAAEGELSSRPSYRAGEGLIGQAALDLRMISLSELPDAHVRISSGLGDSLPRHLLLVPVPHENEVVAIVELAAFQPFGDTELELLEQLRENLGAAIQGVLDNMELQRLYQESQAMTEELQVQAEELQTQAEELQTQQEELIASNDSLRQSEDRLIWQKQTLELQKEEMASISKYKSEFMANMSHELRTPLNSMLILSQLLAENKEGNLTGKQIEFAQTINVSGSDLLRLINEILDLSKVEAGKMELQLEHYALEDLKESLERSFQPIAEKKGLQFRIQAASGLPDALFTDGHRLQQILRNLLSNAFKFTHRGSITLQIDRPATPLYGTDGHPVSGLCFSVIDTGIGIPPEKLDVIFEAFQQLDGTTSRKYGGTGLGLTISREMARLLSGTLQVQSTQGRGSQFILTIPEQLGDEASIYLNPADTEAAAAVTDGDTAERKAWGQDKLDPLPAPAVLGDAAFEPASLRGRTVLLVEDDIRNVFALSTYLEKLELTILYAETGLEALDQLERHPDVDLVIMDIMMPELDGFETMRRIRHQLRFQQLPIIALSAKAMKEDQRKCMEAGASAYMNKPVDLQKLYSHLTYWLELS
ncbi:CHASE3 domain-containing protein [Paenibacillus filicis]|uniref:histidine kinase n=1 Tax=Paenibacillus filicis TaxID=669464 RepID=A0ABU9DIG2_9BACL